MILLIDNYDSFTYNLVHYLQDVSPDVDVEVVRNDALTVTEALAKGADAIVLSPGPCTPNEAGICMELISSAPDDLPILGVCLGHQAIGQVMGAIVDETQLNSVLQGRVVAQHELDHRHEHQQQREGRDERVVGQQRSERAGVVITELAHDGEREGDHGVRALPRTPRELGRAIDAREFWEAFGLMPVRGRGEEARA